MGRRDRVRENGSEGMGQRERVRGNRSEGTGRRDRVGGNGSEGSGRRERVGGFGSEGSGLGILQKIYKSINLFCCFIRNHFIRNRVFNFFLSEKGRVYKKLSTCFRSLV